MKLSALFLSVACLSAVAGPAMAQNRFSYSSDGSEVTDSKTGLVWRRCAEGMTWSGSTCTGTADQFTRDSALVHAKNQTGWRLPNVKELASIVDRSRFAPAIDVTAFPAVLFSSSAWFWSSSPSPAGASFAWIVNFTDGQVNGGTPPSYANAVRLVR